MELKEHSNRRNLELYKGIETARMKESRATKRECMGQLKKKKKKIVYLNSVISIITLYVSDLKHFAKKAIHPP